MVADQSRDGPKHVLPSVSVHSERRFHARLYSLSAKDGLLDMVMPADSLVEVFDGSQASQAPSTAASPIKVHQEIMAVSQLDLSNRGSNVYRERFSSEL